MVEVVWDRAAADIKLKLLSRQIIWAGAIPFLAIYPSRKAVEAYALILDCFDFSISIERTAYLACGRGEEPKFPNHGHQ